MRLGPRQVGKSTLLKSLNPDLSLNFSDPRTFREYVVRPEKLSDELHAAGDGIKTILLDEVQKVPSLLDVVQVILDNLPGRFRFLLSGSSARKLRKGHANLLPGRIHVHHLHPLLASELGTEFSLNRVLAHGSLPGIYAETDPKERAASLSGYADIYLREEIQAEALVRDVGGYGRLGSIWPEAKMSHYRNRHGAEVDFVVEAGKEIWGIEVKSSRDSAGVRLSGLESLQDRVGRLGRKIVVFLGKRRQVRDEV